MVFECRHCGLTCTERLDSSYCSLSRASSASRAPIGTIWGDWPLDLAAPSRLNISWRPGRPLTSPLRSVWLAVLSRSSSLMADTSSEDSLGCSRVRSSFRHASDFISSTFSRSPVLRDCWMLRSSVRMAAASSRVSPRPASVNLALTVLRVSTPRCL